MNETELTISERYALLDRGRAGGTYAYQWHAFVDWCKETGVESLPASSEDVARYLEARAEAGARPSTIKVVAAAISRAHQEAGQDNPCVGVALTTLAKLTQDQVSGPQRSLPLDFNAYMAIRETVYSPRVTRGGRLEREDSALRRGAFDVAMIGLMRDARLRVREATALTWADLKRTPGGGSVRIRGMDGLDEPEYRFVSEDTMKLLSEVRHGAEDDAPIIGLMTKQLGSRISAAAKQAGLGDGYSGESPRLGMLQDLETIGISLLGSQASRRIRPSH